MTHFKVFTEISFRMKEPFLPQNLNILNPRFMPYINFRRGSQTLYIPLQVRQHKSALSRPASTSWEHRDETLGSFPSPDSDFEAFWSSGNFEFGLLIHFVLQEVAWLDLSDLSYDRAPRLCFTLLFSSSSRFRRFLNSDGGFFPHQLPRCCFPASSCVISGNNWNRWLAFVISFCDVLSFSIVNGWTDLELLPDNVVPTNHLVPEFHILPWVILSRESKSGDWKFAAFWSKGAGNGEDCLCPYTRPSSLTAWQFRHVG